MDTVFEFLSQMFGGDGSTVAFWLALGIGLLAVGLTPRPT